MNRNNSLDRRTFVTGTFATGALVAAGAAACGCSAPTSTDGSQGAASLSHPPDDTQKNASAMTADANEAVYALLDFSDERERDFASRNLIAAPETLELTDESGKVVWSQKAYAFLDGADGSPAEAPATANPSLWRNAQLNHLYGLFEVVEGIYQVRGYDMTNITFVAGDTGWIVFDPLMSVECSRAAFELVTENLGSRPVTGIVMSHPHVDHYGGIKGIVSEEEVAERSIPIIVPAGFAEHAVAENVYAGNAMGRRASYQYGVMLDPGPQGSLSIGIGMGQSKGSISYIAPTDTIVATGDVRTIDGVTMEFQMTPGTEAPAEMNTWFPDLKALWVAENCTGTLHNLYTLRGAEVRDGNAWANYLMETKARYGAEAQVTFQAHNWPHWGNDVVNEYLESTAAMYKFITDQTLMYVNLGYTSTEIANMIELPSALEKNWYTRQYYGTVRHNAKAVYQKYMGWYDANPVNLHPLAPADTAKKFVEYFGDTDAVLARATQDFEAGEYQWVAQVTNLIVFADPANEAARLLCADALEQLGYAAESGTWRNAYLTGAKELRFGVDDDPKYRTTGSADIQRAMEPAMMLDYLGILIDANAAQDLDLRINLAFTDEETYLLVVRSGVVLYERGVQDESADATLTMERLGMFAILNRDEEAQKAIRVEGDPNVIAKLTEHMAAFEFFFNIVEP
ncbi:alkyl/aryl-sulfatase [Raoultibacter timonensis]|uniref:SDS hydrolase SdsA1 n=1 Tax=Raoultibacter timonensis TaxID=1907662 RepID=A0ABN6MK46_9ACTN|nr:alkyl sulfatase dimerization domain-containing protein [Raoultibacter timonensis]BDE97649.1 SDS hydrolase SdsA1 [Raoultibacter timonensis]BDF52252.1 SDS hydrolase SdsA1 [Raoultibacter timonensis]